MRLLSDSDVEDSGEGVRGDDGGPSAGGEQKEESGEEGSPPPKKKSRKIGKRLIDLTHTGSVYSTLHY